MEASSHAVPDTVLRPSRHRRRPAVGFGLHYLEMVAVMFAGMGVFWAGLALGAAPLGYELGALEDDAPAFILAGMGASMTIPMVWWMRFRGHSWAANRAMATSMVAPTAGVLVLLALGTGGDVHDLMGIQHMVMFPAMFAAMLLHRGDYLHSD